VSDSKETPAIGLTTLNSLKEQTMKQFRTIAVGAVASAVALGLGLAVAAAYAHPGAGIGPQGDAPGGSRAGSMQGMGMGSPMMHGGHGGSLAAQQLLTPEERQAFIEKMRSAKTAEERQKLAEANRAEIEKRAKEKGITLPEAHGPGAGSGPHSGSTGMMRHMGPASAASHGPMGGPMAGPMTGRKQQDDASFGTDMQLVHSMLDGHDRIKRAVTNLPNGIRTVTESDDPQVAQMITTHVASMVQRLDQGRVFNLFSPTLPVLFENKDKIKTKVETTEKGSIVTQTSNDAAVVTALQAHAVEVSDLAREGRVAMMRSARAAMGMMAHGPGSGMGPSMYQPPQPPAASVPVR
jgi:hypothetical protein